MKINLNTKFNVDDTGYVWVFNTYIPVQIIGIKVLVDKKGIEVSYEVDDALVREVKETEILTENEVTLNNDRK
ncbi:hypothetical protein [Bacillus thuringiensis]|uniref:Uncharacterized protein n=1 Tax=Bacillus thuringiensis TaxID=1428 RepID=A0A9X6ZQX7_BACTU|nr:hypothetical protein [Bacillus thuringiensis]PFJ32291.1 hypothetical protein COJ15_28900 [Bacillus thuringiensis]